MALSTDAKRLMSVLLCLALAAVVALYAWRIYVAQLNLALIQSTFVTALLEHDPAMTPSDARALVHAVGMQVMTWDDVKKKIPWPQEKLARYRTALELLRGQGDMGKPFLYDVSADIPLAEDFNAKSWPPGVLTLFLDCYWVQEGFEVQASQVALLDAEHRQVRLIKRPVQRQSENPYAEGDPRDQRNIRLHLVHEWQSAIICVDDLTNPMSASEAAKDSLAPLASVETMEVSLLSTRGEVSNAVAINVCRLRDFLAASRGSKDALLSFATAQYVGSEDWIAFLLSRNNIFEYEWPATANGYTWTSRVSGKEHTGPTGSDIRQFVLGHKDALAWDAGRMKWVIGASPKTSPETTEPENSALH